MQGIENKAEYVVMGVENLMESLDTPILLIPVSSSPSLALPVWDI